VTNHAGNPDNYCYRHPDRQSYIVCQRCGRTICPDCQTPAAVGVHCPECTREARRSAPRHTSRLASALRLSSGRPVVSYGIIAVTLVVFLAQFVTQGAVTNTLLYWPPLTAAEPWRMVTTMLVHSQQSIFHVLFNMYGLFILGPPLEQMIGRWRFGVLYVLSGFAGSVAVLLLSPSTAVVGASGAIFGLLGAFFVIQRHFGGSNIQIIVVIVLNLVIGFVVPGIAWQAHVGGIAVGALVALSFVRTRRRTQQRLQYALVAGIAVTLVIASVAGVNYWF